MSYRFEYDEFGSRKSVKVGSQELINFTHAANNGHLTKTTYGNGNYSEPVYDSLDRVISMKYNGIEKYNWVYGLDGKVGIHNDLVNNVTWRYEYTTSGDVTLAVGSNGEKFAYAYDTASGYLISSDVTAGGVSKKTAYNYSDRTGEKDKNVLESITLPSAVIKYNHDGFYRTSSTNLTVSDTDILTTSYGFLSGTAENSTTSMISSVANSGSNWNQTLNYTYDANGNIEIVSEGGEQKAKYYYDALNQLIREDNAWLGKTVAYTYDKGGNIQLVEEYELTSGSLEGLTATKSYSYLYGDSNWKDKLTSYDGNAITYDQIGNPINYYDGTVFTWQDGRQLAGITKANGDGAVYTYNSDGIRTSKTVKGVTTDYTLEGDRVVRESNGTDTIWYYYDAGGSITGFELNGVTYYYVKNLQGDIVAIIDENGAKVVEYTYDSWGKLISTTGTLVNTVGEKNPYRYRGYRYDAETGLYYLNSRYYDPEVGRFINADGYVSTGQGLSGHNMFVYCGNNPINNSDPSGQFFVPAILIVIVAVTTFTLTLSGCSNQQSTNGPRKDLVNAPNLDVDTASPNSYNCYGNGIGKQINANPTGYNRGDSTRKTFNAVKNDLGSNNVRELSSIDDAIGTDEFKVALKCGTTDYHFIRLTENGWYNKSGSIYPGLYVDQSVVAKDVWQGMAIINGEYYEGPPFYTDETIYFAVKVGWDTQ